MMSHSREDMTKLRKSYLTSFLVKHKGKGCRFRDSVQLSSKNVDFLDEKVVEILNIFQSATGKSLGKKYRQFPGKRITRRSPSTQPTYRRVGPR